LGSHGENRVHISARRAVYQERGDHCEVFGVEKGFAQGAGIGDADAELLHQSGRTRAQRGEAGGTGKGEEAAFHQN